MSVANTICFPDALLCPNKTIDFGQPKESAKVFNTLAGMYGLAIIALENLRAGKLAEFDSLATDCSCHLRALRIAAVVQELCQPKSPLGAKLNLTLEDLKAKYALLKSVGSDLTVWCQKGKKLNGDLTPIVTALQALKAEKQTEAYSFTLQDTLGKLKGRSEVLIDLAYFIHAYLLKIVKDFKTVEMADDVACADQACGETLVAQDLVKKEFTKCKKLSEAIKALLPKTDISANLIEKEVYRLAKKHLTDLSTTFLLQETAKLRNPHTFSLLKMSHKVVEGKIELPDYYSLTGAFQVCLQRQIPVLLKVKKCLHAHRYQEPGNPFDVYVYLVPNKAGTSFEYASFLDLKHNGPLVVVEGKRSGKAVAKEPVKDYVKRLMKGFDFMHVCAMDGAQHKQYTSDDDSLLQKPSEVIPPLKDKTFAVEAQRLDGLREKAEKVGCAFSNQSLLILSHIFADTIQNQQEELDMRLKNAKLIQYDPHTETFKDE